MLKFTLYFSDEPEFNQTIELSGNINFVFCPIGVTISEYSFADCDFFDSLFNKTYDSANIKTAATPAADFIF